MSLAPLDNVEYTPKRSIYDVFEPRQVLSDLSTNKKSLRVGEPTTKSKDINELQKFINLNYEPDDFAPD